MMPNVIPIVLVNLNLTVIDKKAYFSLNTNKLIVKAFLNNYSDTIKFRASSYSIKHPA